jgi:hypothetical protein
VTGIFFPYGYKEPPRRAIGAALSNSGRTGLLASKASAVPFNRLSMHWQNSYLVP